MSAAYRWTVARKERMLRALSLAEQWEGTLAAALPVDDGEGAAEALESAKQFRTMRAELMAAWGYHEVAS